MAVEGSSVQGPGACFLSLTGEELEQVPSSGLYSGVGHAQEKPSYASGLEGGNQTHFTEGRNLSTQAEDQEGLPGRGDLV